MLPLTLSNPISLRVQFAQCSLHPDIVLPALKPNELTFLSVVALVPAPRPDPWPLELSPELLALP